MHKDIVQTEFSRFIIIITIIIITSIITIVIMSVDVSMSIIIVNISISVVWSSISMILSHRAGAGGGGVPVQLAPPS